MKMTKRDLFEALKPLPDDANIILASDEEGNGFGLLWDTEIVTKDNKITAIILWPASGTVEVEDN